MSFEVPSTTAPFDVGAAVTETPADATARGMFFNDVLGDIRAAGRQLDGFASSYIAFKSYPLRDYVRLNIAAAKLLYPDEPLRGALIKIGAKIYPRFAETVVGKSIFAIAGNRFDRIVKLCAKAYDVSVSSAQVKVLAVEDGQAHIDLKGVPLVDTLQIGNWRGAMDAVGVKGDILIKRHAAMHAELRVTWR